MEKDLEAFQNGMEAFLALPAEDQRRRLEEASRQAKEISDRFDQAIRFTTEEARRFLDMPMTI